MDVVSICPLRAAGVLWQSTDGPALTVLCKATYALQAGECSLAEDQRRPLRADRPWDGTPGTSVREPSDYLPDKPRADVLLVGHAHASGGRAVATIVTRLQLGEIDKRIEAHGERWVDDRGEVVESKAVARVALRWENAAGGPDTSNPVGVGPDSIDELGRIVLPQLQPHGARNAPPSEPFAPACYGPLGPSWPDRADLLGPHAGRFSPERWWATPLPEGLDRRYFNLAPIDQQIERLEGNEPLVLERLLPDAPRFASRLPGFRPAASIGRGPSRRRPVDLVLGTVWIDTDERICTVCWHGLVCGKEATAPGRIEVTIEQIAPRVIAVIPGTVLGRGGSSGREPPSWLDDPDGGVTEPFIPPSEVPEPNAGSSEDAAVDAAELAPGPDASAASRFEPDAEGRPRPKPVRTAPRPGKRTARPKPATGPKKRAGRGGTKSEPGLRRSSTRNKRSPAAEPTREEAASRRARERVSGSAASGPEAAEPRLPPTGELRPIGLEPCAALAASIARRPSETPKILEAAGVSLPVWKGNDAYWTEVLREEAARGDSRLLQRYDAAYVARIEAERGPIGIDEYARLVLAAEQRSPERTLGDLGIAREAMVRIERVFLRRVAQSRRLGEQIRKAVEALRGA